MLWGDSAIHQSNVLLPKNTTCGVRNLGEGGINISPGMPGIKVYDVDYTADGFRNFCKNERVKKKNVKKKWK